MDFETYLDTLASAAPTPGGGSAATLVGALGAALCEMVARLTAGNPKHAAVHTEAAAVIAAAGELRTRFVSLRLPDEEAFRGVVAAQALARTTDAERAERTARLQAALTRAAEVPLATACAAADLAALVARTAALRNEHLASDVTCARAFAAAALTASAANVRVNHRYLRDPETVAAQDERLRGAETEAHAHDARAGDLLVVA